MPSVLDPRPSAKFDVAALAAGWNPPLDDECEPFMSPEDVGPSRLDEAWFSGYLAGLETDSTVWPGFKTDRMTHLAFLAGRHEGRQDRRNKGAARVADQERAERDEAQFWAEELAERDALQIEMLERERLDDAYPGPAEADVVPLGSWT